MQISFQCSNGQRVSENFNMTFLIPPNVIETMSLSVDFKQTLGFCCGCKSLRQNCQNWTAFKSSLSVSIFKGQIYFLCWQLKSPMIEIFNKYAASLQGWRKICPNLGGKGVHRCNGKC